MIKFSQIVNFIYENASPFEMYPYKKDIKIFIKAFRVKIFIMSIFREYIGVKPNPITLDDFPSEIINPLITEFHFILGFAKEVHDENGKGTGQFKPTWNMDYFSPEKVAFFSLLFVSF